MNQIGEYNILVTNTVNGCASKVDMFVVTGSLTVNFEPDILSGFAPLTVNFQNTSSSALGVGSITSVWSFGNGISNTLTSAAPVTTTYDQPGTYTVSLFAAKGSLTDTSLVRLCKNISYKIIKVEIPS